MQRVECYDIFEEEIMGKTDGNPFVDQWVQATFEHEKETKTVDGFYNGDGMYLVRFMPSYEGVYTYHIKGSCFPGERTGEFLSTPVLKKQNHGPVRVKDTYYFEYADHTPYLAIGTTCYGWIHQVAELQKTTLKTLRNSCFNKVRFSIFPKYYIYNYNEPLLYPYERGEERGQQVEEQKSKFPVFTPPDGVTVEKVTDFDCYRFHIEFFEHLDTCMLELRDMGIEADLILMHPYDKWGFATMNEECDDLYIKYLIARYGAYRNVWWSLANEYDLFPNKSPEDWERYAKILCEKDVYGHLRSIHNCYHFYDFTKPWVTHCCMQRQNTDKQVEATKEYQEKYKKPIVWDEISYEGNIEWGWGNIAPEELVRRFWETYLRGGYATHGETYVVPSGILWWSKGGVLRGESEPRIHFLLDMVRETPGGFLKQGNSLWDEVVGIPYQTEQKEGETYQYPVDYEIHYYGAKRPAFRRFTLPENTTFEIEIIDTYEMTIKKLGEFHGEVKIELPGKPYMATRLKKVK